MKYVVATLKALLSFVCVVIISNIVMILLFFRRTSWNPSSAIGVTYLLATVAAAWSFYGTLRT